jgi:hypothetical protein
MKKNLLLLSATALLSSATCCKDDTDIPSPEQAAACSLVPDAGMCLAAIPRYYFDPKEKKCKQFTWGGCGGVVPFVTLKECEDCGCK